jgi:hypothetical protein
MTQTKGRRLTGPEIVEEVEWLLSFHRDPSLIAQELGRSCDSIYKIGVRWGSDRIREAYSALGKEAYRERVEARRRNARRRQHAA